VKIKIKKPHNLQALYAKAQNDAKKHNITWQGNLEQGHGEGYGFKGHYVVDEEYITITVLKKPLLATKARIEREVAAYVAMAVTEPHC